MSRRRTGRVIALSGALPGVLAALLCVYAALCEITARPWVAFGLYVPFLALSFVPWHTNGSAVDYNALYYAAFPSRYFGPLIVLWLFARHLRRGSPPLWVLFFAAGLAAEGYKPFAAIYSLANGM